VSFQEGHSIFKSISIYISIYPLVLCMFNSSDLSCASNRAICIIRSISLSTVTQLYKFNPSCLYHLSKRAIWITILIYISIYSYSFTGYIHYIVNSSSPVILPGGPPLLLSQYFPLHVHIICFSVYEAWSASHPFRRATFITVSTDFQDSHNSHVTRISL
jgi:hypothetical protein